MSFSNVEKSHVTLTDTCAVCEKGRWRSLDVMFP